MKGIVKDWYIEKSLHPYKLIQRGKQFGYTRGRIEKAMELGHFKINILGNKVPDIQVARYVFNLAGELGEKEYDDENNIIEITKKENRRLKSMAIGMSLAVIAASLFIIVKEFIK